MVKTRSPSHSNVVGVGGLEPPTSASQTRRAGRLRYTPADKSIIRSMLKRQDAGSAAARLILFIIAVFFLFLSSACQLPPTPPEQTPSPTAISINPTQRIEPSPTTTWAHASPTSPTPTPTPDCRQLGGEIIQAGLFSELLEKELNYIIYLPPCYQDLGAEGLPTLYLLHGFSYNKDQWLRLGLAKHMDALIASNEIPPFIVVLPEESPSLPPQASSFPEILTQELIPWIDAQYNTRAEKAACGIGGVSRGAAWAVQIGFEHPDLFCCVGAHSLPLFQADGGKINRWLTQTPVDQLPRVLIDIGRNDQEWPTAKAFADQLDAAHVAHEWYLFNGDHNEAFWSSHLDLYLQWYSANW
jgi:enterochelin esterase-like enzyme